MDEITGSAQLEQQTEESRSRLTGKLDQLRENLTPANMVDEVMENAKLGGASLAHSISDVARQNPIAMILIGAGCALLAAGSAAAKPSGGAQAGAGLEPLGSDASMYPASFGDNSSSSSTVADGVRSVTSKVMETGSSLGAQLSEKAGNYSGAARTRFNDAASTISEKVGSWSSMDGLTEIIKQQPLMAAALGITVGAAVGAMLPSTDAEDSLMGNTRDTAASKVLSIAEQQYDSAKAVASNVAAELMASADEHGISTEAAKNLVSEMAKKATSAIDQTHGEDS